MVLSFYSPLKTSLYDVETWWITALDEGSMFHIVRENSRNCFFYNKVSLHAEFMEPGITINADTYCNTLLYLHQAIKKKKTFIDTETHSSAVIMVALIQQQWLFACFFANFSSRCSSFLQKVILSDISNCFFTKKFDLKFSHIIGVLRDLNYILFIKELMIIFLSY